MSNENICDENTLFQSVTTYSRIYNENHLLYNAPSSQYVEISIVTEGSGYHRVFNETTECHAGDAYIIGGGISHGYFARSEYERPTVTTISFDVSSWFDGELSNIHSPNYCGGVFRDELPFSYALLNSKTMDELKGTFRSILQESTQKGANWKVSVRSLLYLMMVTLGRYVNLADTLKKDHPRDWITVSATMRHVLDEYGDSELTLEKIASDLYVSASHLSKIFKKVAGESFADYVRKVRVNNACEFLATSEMTNEEIIKRCGLKDLPSFYKLFKSVTGITPHQYRSMRKSKGKFLSGDHIMSIVNEISENLQRGKAKIVRELVEKALAEGVSVNLILNEGLLDGMSIIGQKFKNNEIYVPEVLVAARAMNMGMQVLSPLLAEKGTKPLGKVCIGTVQGDLHDIGKNLVKMMLEGKGLEVVDLGVDVPAERFVSAAIENDCQIICCSALLTTTMGVMKDVVDEAVKAGVRDKVKIMIGGAPITDEYCAQIGADAYTLDAASAADKAVELLTK